MAVDVNMEVLVDVAAAVSQRTTRHGKKYIVNFEF
jgi:hypothetical protein